MNLVSRRTWREARRQITNRWNRFYNSIWMPVLVIGLAVATAAVVNRMMP